MQTINRAEAKTLGLNKYFTGYACPRGHVAQRYTQSGTCCECLAVAPAPPSANTMSVLEEYRQREAQRVEALGLLVDIKIWSKAGDIDELRETAVACCLGVFPCLTHDDVKVTYGPTAENGVAGHYRVRVPLEYVEFMRSLSQVYLDRHVAATSAADLDKTRDMLNDILRKLGQSSVV